MAKVTVTFDTEDWSMVIQALNFTRRAEMRAEELTKTIIGTADGFSYAERAVVFARLERSVEQQVTAATPPRFY